MLLTNPLVLMDNLQMVSLLFVLAFLYQNVAGQTQTCIFHMSIIVHSSMTSFFYFKHNVCTILMLSKQL